jgi:hypothetical protein
LWNWDSTHILAKGPWYLRSKLWGLKFNIDCNGKAFKNWFLLRTRIGNEICAIVKLLDHCDMQIFASLPECRLQGLARKMLIGSTAEKKEKKSLDWKAWWTSILTLWYMTKCIIEQIITIYILSYCVIGHFFLFKTCLVTVFIPEWHPYSFMLELLIQTGYKVLKYMGIYMLWVV